MNHRLLILAWLATLAAFFTLGINSQSSHSVLEEENRITVPQSQPQPEPPIPVVAREDDSPIKTEIHPAYAPGDYREILATGMADPYGDPKLYAFLERVPFQYFEEIIQDTLNRRWVDTHDAGMILAIIYRRWAHLDLNAAMQSAFEIQLPSMCDDALAAVVGIYAAKDPVGALEYYKSYLHGEAHLNNKMGGRIIRNLARFDPNRAISETAAFLEDGERPGWMTNELARGLLEKKTASEAFGLIAGVNSSGFQEAMVSAILSNDIWKNERPMETLATVQRLPKGELRDQAIEQFPIRWAAKEPQEATEWLINQSDRELKTKQIATVFGTWFDVNPSASAEWLNQRPITPELDPAVENLVQQVMRNGDDPATAFTWTLSYSDESDRREGDAQWTLREWLKRGADSAEAHQLVDESKLPDSEKHLLHSLIRRHQ